MPTISKEDLEYILQIIREMIKQEIDTRIPIHTEIIDLKVAVKELAEAQRKTEERLERLEKAVENLTEAQRKTEERLNALTEAQRKTEERLERLEKVVENLTEAQKRTEERLNALAEAQRKTEERLERLEKVVENLAEAQRKTEERLNALTEAQRKTEEELHSLVLVVKDLQKQVGGISHSVGFDLENQSYKYLPNLLKRDFGIVVKGRLIRKFIKNKKGESLEINIIGKGERNGKEINIIGEAKTNLSVRHIEDFIDRLKDIKEVFEGEIFPIIVTHMTEPETEEYAIKKGIKVYYSYDFE